MEICSFPPLRFVSITFYRLTLPPKVLPSTYAGISVGQIQLYNFRHPPLRQMHGVWIQTSHDLLYTVMLNTNLQQLPEPCEGLCNEFQCIQLDLHESNT